jgi:hypothetical protein
MREVEGSGKLHRRKHENLDAAKLPYRVRVAADGGRWGHSAAHTDLRSAGAAGVRAFCATGENGPATGVRAFCATGENDPATGVRAFCATGETRN